jgi:hypothetical protein
MILPGANGVAFVAAHSPSSSHARSSETMQPAPASRYTSVMPLLYGK